MKKQKYEYDKPAKSENWNFVETGGELTRLTKTSEKKPELTGFTILTDISKNDLILYDKIDFIYNRLSDIVNDFMVHNNKKKLLSTYDEICNSIMELNEWSRSNYHNDMRGIPFLLDLMRYYMQFITSLKMYETNFWKKLNEKEKKLFDKEIKKLEKNIPKPKSYDMDELSKFYVNFAKQLKAKPSVRELAKYSSWNKDKWSDKLKDYKLIGNIFMTLQEEKSNNKKIANEQWFQILFDEYQNKFAKIQMKVSQSNAMEFNENF